MVSEQKQIECSLGLLCLLVITMNRDRVAGSCNSPPARRSLRSFLMLIMKVPLTFSLQNGTLQQRRIRGLWFGQNGPLQRLVSLIQTKRKARNAIVTAIPSSQFSHIQHCPTAWDKLRVVHKGDQEVRNLKLQTHERI